MTSRSATALDPGTERELRRMAVLYRRGLLRALPGPNAGGTAGPRPGRPGRRHTSPVTIPVRTAGESDADAVAMLAQSAYRGEASRQGWTTEADLLDGQRADASMVAQLVATPGSLVLVVDDVAQPGRLLACCHLERRGEAAYLGLFAVRPDAQGQGVGTAMLAAAEAQARRWGALRLELTVLNHRPELVAWYSRCGFTITGDTVPFPYGDERYGVPRRDDLVLQVMTKALEPV